jgi:hypothetical protein
MIPTRGRGGGHDRICVDALLWVDHVEIRLLLSRIKAVWAAMRHVRGVVAIVMVHEVKGGEQGSPVVGGYKKKKSRREKKKREKREGKRRRRRGRERAGEEREREMRFSTVLRRSFPKPETNDFSIRFLFLTQPAAFMSSL